MDLLESAKRKWLSHPPDLHKKIILISIISIGLAVLAYAWPVPGFVVICTVWGIYLGGKSSQRAAGCLVPVFAFLTAVVFAYAVNTVQSLPRLDLKNGGLINRPAPPVVWESWFSGRRLSNPANVAGRLGLVAGSAAGLMLVWYLGVRSSKKHNARYVHGLPVAEQSAKGTSRWAGDKDIAHVCEFGPPREGPQGGGTVLGKLEGRIVRAQMHKCTPPLPGHMLIVAGTGGGKTYSGVIPNTIAAACEGESMVLTDPKGELACLLAPWLKSRGYEVYLFNLAHPRWSSFWNPVLECRDDEEVTAFATAIVQNAAADKSGYFLMKEIQLLKALVYLLKADFPVEQAHLRSALSLLSWPVEALNERFVKAYRSGRLPVEGYEEWCGAVSSNYENAVSGLSAKLNVIRGQNIARLLSRHEINLSLIGRKKAALFCVLPVNSKHLKPLLATFYYFFFKRLYDLAAENGGRLPNPTRFLLDEFANIGQVPDFSEVISTARSLGIKIQFVLQGLKQLMDNYGAAEAENIIANCPIQIFLGGDDKTTTQYFSSRLGDAAVWAVTERHDVSIPGKKYFELPRRSESVVRRSLMEPEELSRMDPMAAVALVRWCLPMYLQKLGWDELPQAEEIKRTAVKSLDEVLPERDLKLELPDIPGGEPVGPKKRDRSVERGSAGSGGIETGIDDQSRQELIESLFGKSPETEPED